MTENQFKSLMLQAEMLCAGDYLAGYQRGLRRLYHGESFGTMAEHEQWLTLSGHQAERGRGYRDGFAGKEPVFMDESA